MRALRDRQISEVCFEQSTQSSAFKWMSVERLVGQTSHQPLRIRNSDPLCILSSKHVGYIQYAMVYALTYRAHCSKTNAFTRVPDAYSKAETMKLGTCERLVSQFG